MGRCVKLINKNITENLLETSKPGLQASVPEKPTTGVEIERRSTSDKPAGIKSSSFIIQKYMESPLLINKRKFDIRVWVLVTQD